MVTTTKSKKPVTDKRTKAELLVLVEAQSKRLTSAQKLIDKFTVNLDGQIRYVDDLAARLDRALTGYRVAAFVAAVSIAVNVWAAVEIFTR